MARNGIVRRGIRLAILFTLIAVVTAAGVSAALGASGENAPRSSRDVLEQQRVAKHKRAAKHQRKRKHRAKSRQQSRKDGARAQGPVELAPGVTESPNGWIHYEPLPAGPDVQLEKTVRFDGTPVDGGAGCKIEKPSQMPPQGRELFREEIAYNPDTCEAVYLERLIGEAPKSGGAQTRVVPGSSSEVDYKSGHNMQLWVDPIGITITGLSVDYTWPLDDAPGEPVVDPYSYKFALDGWRAGLIEKDLIPVSKERPFGEDERMWGSANPNSPAGGNRATAYRRFENIDFYKAVKAAKMGFVCHSVPMAWTVFEQEVAVTGYYNGRMGTWQHSVKSGPCTDLVHSREKVAWGTKRGKFPKEFKDEFLNKIWNGTPFSKIIASLASMDRMAVNKGGTSPVPSDLLPIDINQTSVTVDGSVNPRGKSTNWWAQCGPTEAYGMWASGQVNIGSGVIPVPVSVTVPNLQPNTTYHCRMVTLNMNGEASVGPDSEFTTSEAAAPSVATAYTTDITDTSAKILGWLNGNAAATNFYFQWGKTTAYGNNSPAPPGWSANTIDEPFLAGYSLTDLEPGTTYHYRLVASNVSGTNYGEDQTFTTRSLIPSVTTGPAVEITTSDAKLTGSINPNGLATSYWFEYGKTTDYQYREPWHAPPGNDIGSGTSIVQVGAKVWSIEIGATYHYRLVARNAHGTTYGEDKTFTALTYPPGATTLPAIQVGEAKARLSGAVSPNGATTYYFQFGKTTAYGTNYPQVPESVGSDPRQVPVSYEVFNLEPGVTYHYRTVASNSSGSSYGKDETFTTLTPSTPRIEPTTAGEVTQSKITMASKVDVKGLAGTYYFEYGNLEKYGSKTEEKAVPAGSGYQQVSAALEGLPNGSTIHYRVVVTNSDRTVRGTDQVATTGWTNEPSATPKGSKSDKLTDVSCPSAGNCVAVGTFESFSSTDPKVSAERWDGTSWTAIEPPLPAGTLLSELRGVSCVAVNNCIAVGFATSGVSAARPLIMKWNGSTWTEVSAGSQLPAGSQHVLNDISCPAANSCEAVGYSIPSSGALKTLAMHWDGSVWTVRASANPKWPGSVATKEDMVLAGVDCASATFCKAVGRISTSFGGRPLIERLNGSEWLSETTQPPSSNVDTALNDVSCPTTAMCVAVGNASTAASAPFPSPEAAFIQLWNGSQWSFDWAPSANETGAAMGLGAVSCSSPTSCRAVGAGGRGVRWTGKDWRLQAAKLPLLSASPTSGQSGGISCPTAAECHSVGSYQNTAGIAQRLTQGWSGSSTVPGTLGDAATVNGETGATVRAFVDPAGVDTKYYFEYGPTESYGTKTAETSAGSGGLSFNSGARIAVAVNLGGLQPGVRYHYRVVATNGTSTAYGPDTTFETLNKVNGMPLTEEFDGTTSPISDFATKWAPLQWAGAAHKGNNTAGGYAPVDTALNGAYYMPMVTDGGLGIAAQATIMAAPGVGGRVSLWLDMGSPATAKSGYQLVFQETSLDTYTVTLKKWLNGVETSLASKTGYYFPPASSMSLVDIGGAVSAWGNLDGNFAKIVGATDSGFSAGNAGVEVSGSSAARVTRFKVGTLCPEGPNFDFAAIAIPKLDPLDRNESPLSLSGAWGAFGWATTAVKPGKVVSGSGWTSGETTSAMAGAYWQKATIGDTGTGDAVIVTNNKAIGSSPNSIGLWLNAANPGSATRNGYQLRVTEVSTGVDLKVWKWVNNVPTQLGSKLLTTGAWVVGAKFALIERDGTVSAWWSPNGGTFSRATIASDTTYSYGYAGVEASGTTALKDFKAGILPQF
ncbi:MAG TPA: hypothetical protein VFN92_13555 [Solirubrobacterales bacterium]|nr:hypothetical protein [Solirubrobacterales bacterium]